MQERRTIVAGGTLRVPLKLPAYGLGDRVIVTRYRQPSARPFVGRCAMVVGIDLVEPPQLRLRLWLDDVRSGIKCGEDDVRPLSAVEQLAELAGQEHG